MDGWMEHWRRFQRWLRLIPTKTFNNRHLSANLPLLYATKQSKPERTYRSDSEASKPYTEVDADEGPGKSVEVANLLLSFDLTEPQATLSDSLMSNQTLLLTAAAAFTIGWIATCLWWSYS